MHTHTSITQRSAAQQAAEAPPIGRSSEHHAQQKGLPHIYLRSHAYRLALESREAAHLEVPESAPGGLSLRDILRKYTRETHSVDEKSICSTSMLASCAHSYEFEKTASACFPRAYNLRVWMSLPTA